MGRAPHFLLLALTAAVAGAAACDTGAAAVPAESVLVVPDGPGAFEPNTAATYVAKVKNILVGLPPTDDEVRSVALDPPHLEDLIDQWMAYPEYTTKMLRFFELAFRQTQISTVDFAEQMNPRQLDLNPYSAPLLVQNATESFARTMIELTSHGQPLTNATTTRTFMMTPALMELYAFFDAWQVSDTGATTDGVARALPGAKITVEASEGPISSAETVDPTSPRFMHWYDPDLASAATTLGPSGCQTDPLVYPVSSITLHYLLYGVLDGRPNPNGGTACFTFWGSANAPQITGTDFTAWRMVTVRPQNPGESTTRFYDLATLRSANELVLELPRVGFFSTPAFFANWQTNASNEMRVTTNQSLIVALGSSIDGTDPTTPSATPGLDAEHAAPGTACFECHRLLDPTRSIFAANYSWYYHQQNGASVTAQKALFAFRGVVAPVASLGDFGDVLASHPLFATAWAQKLCYYAGSALCEANDPELQRVVADFVSSNYDWNTLVRELLSSPLVTYASAAQSALDQGEVVAVSRRDHLCAALDARLGFTDVCGLLPTTNTQALGSIPQIVAGLPSDGYGRGAVAPVLSNAPTLFYRAGTENVCEAVAGMVIDAPSESGVRQWSSMQPGAAIADFLSIVMALPPSDRRAAPAASILTQHFQRAVASGATASDALESTFIAACLAPSSISIGL
jgi:hypothetical protein